MDTDYIIVKTAVQEFNSNFITLGECLFAVKKSEWIEIGKYLEEDSVAYTKGPNEKKLHLYQMYHQANILPASAHVVEFLINHGICSALYYLRKGTIKSKNRDKLHRIFNKLALFREIEKGHCGVEFDPVSIKGSAYYGIEKDDAVLKWRLPKAANCVECADHNNGLLEEMIGNNSATFNHILESKKFWCCVVFCDVMLRIYIPDDVADAVKMGHSSIYDIDVCAEIDPKVGPQCREFSHFGEPKRLNFKIFLMTFKKFKSKKEVTKYFGASTF